jgi:hypothetical protein
MKFPPPVSSVVFALFPVAWATSCSAESPLEASLRASSESAQIQAGFPAKRESCTSVAKSVSATKLVVSYACPVPEESRAGLRNALVAQSWVPEANLNGQLFALRRGKNIATFSCSSPAKACQLKLEYAPQ